MSQQYEPLEFRDIIPTELYRRYFDVIMADEIVYITIIQNESQVGSIYMEQPKESLETVEGVIRVFFKIEDLKRYATSVSNIERIQPDLVRRWEMKFSSCIDTISRLDAKYREAGKKGVRAVGSAIHAEKFIDLDVFWTAEPHLMV